MILREITRALERIEQNQEKILGRLAALERRAVLDAMENKVTNTEKAPDEWIQQGIDSIMNYQVGKKRGDDQ